MPSVMITGGLGFVGMHTARKLAERGERVVVLDPECRASQIEQGDVGWGGAKVAGAAAMTWLPPAARHVLSPYAQSIVFLHGDALNVSEVVAAMQRYDVDRIVHAASLFDPQIEFENPYAAFKVNVEAAVTVFEAARVMKTRRLVFLSSIAAYAPCQHEPMPETHPTTSIVSGSPSGPHGAAKAAAEVLGMTYYSAYGLDFIALRLSAGYGVGMRLPVHIRPMVESAVRGAPCVFEQGQMRREYIYIGDLAAGVVQALDVDASRLKQRIFNISTGVITTTEELAAAVRDVLPTANIKIGTGMSSLEASNVRIRGRLDISAARAQIDFAPKFDLRAGIAAFAADLREFMKDSSLA